MSAMKYRNSDSEDNGQKIRMLIIKMAVQRRRKARPQSIVSQRVGDMSIRRIHCTNGRIIETVIKD